MTGGPYVNLNWERAANGALSAYLSIARPGQAAERIPLPLPAVAQLLADGAMLWSVVEPMRQESMQNLHNAAEPWKLVAPDRSAISGKVSDAPPHFIGVWGE